MWGRFFGGGGRKSPRWWEENAEVLGKIHGGGGEKSPRWWGRNDEVGRPKKTPPRRYELAKIGLLP